MELHWYQYWDKDVSHNFAEPKVTYSNVLFCLNKSPKPKRTQFTIIFDKEKQQTLPFDKLEYDNVEHCFIIFVKHSDGRENCGKIQSKTTRGKLSPELNSYLFYS